MFIPAAYMPVIALRGNEPTKRDYVDMPTITPHPTAEATDTLNAIDDSPSAQNRTAWILFGGKPFSINHEAWLGSDSILVLSCSRNGPCDCILYLVPIHCKVVLRPLSATRLRHKRLQRNHQRENGPTTQKETKLRR